VEPFSLKVSIHPPAELLRFWLRLWPKPVRSSHAVCSSYVDVLHQVVVIACCCIGAYINREHFSPKEKYDLLPIGVVTHSVGL